MAVIAWPGAAPTDEAGGGEPGTLGDVASSFVDGATQSSVAEEGAEGGSPPTSAVTVPPAGPSVEAPTFDSPAQSFDELEARWAESRAAVVAALSDDAYGVGDDNVLRGPGGLRIDLDTCPADWSDTIGVDDSTVRIGLTAPGIGLVGDASDIGAGIDQYFRYLNDRGGVGGRRLELVAREDGNDLARTQEAADDFIGPDGVFAVTTIGTPQALALTDRLGAECVPHPFVMSAHPALADPDGHPFTTTSMLAWSAEAALWGQWIADNEAATGPVRVVALVVDSAFGYEAYAEPFAAWADARPEVVSDFVVVPHPVGAASLVDEMQTVADSAPDVFIAMTAGTDCVRVVEASREVDLGDAVRFHPSVCRDPGLLAPGGSAADGIVVMTGGIEPTTDADIAADDPYLTFVRGELASTGLADNGLYGSGFGYYGWLWGEALQIANELPGGLTRTNLVLTMWSLDLVHPMVDDGVGFSAAGPDDPHLLEGSSLARYDAATGTLVPSTTLDGDGQTPTCALYLTRCG